MALMKPGLARSKGSSSPWAAFGPGLARHSFWLAGALGVWLGLLSLRSYVAMVVWNFEAAPVAEMGLVALSVYAVGLVAWLPARYLGGPRPAWRFGLLLAVLTVARQALPVAMLAPGLAFAAVIVWLWWLPAFLQEAARRGALAAVAPAVLLGLAAQVAGQTGLHGVDLTILTDLWSVLGAIVMAAAFALLLHQGMAAEGAVVPGAEAARPLSPGAEAAAARGALILGSYLFVQLTYLSQLGRAQALTGWGMPAVSVLIQASLLAGLLTVAWNPPRIIRILLGLASVALLLPGELQGMTFLGVILIQAGLASALSRALTPAAAPDFRAQVARAESRPVSGRIYGMTAAGALIFFVMFFVFYRVYGLPVLWPIAAALVILAGAWPGGDAPTRVTPAAALFLVGAALLGLAAGAIPSSRPLPVAGPAPRELKILTYNVFQGFNNDTAPNLQGLAAVIEAANADLVSLAEIPRGGNLSGGHDLAAWLRWRFPNYQVVYGPQDGDSMDIMIMSRYPINGSGTERYRLVTANSLTGQGSPPRGLVWATIPTQGGDLLFVSTHLTAYSRFAADRNAQADALTRLWNRRERTIIAGDFNAGPEDQAIKRLVAAGLTDVAAAQGLGATFTAPARAPRQRIDYIFSSPDVQSVSAQVTRTLASDHFPVQATVRVK